MSITVRETRGTSWRGRKPGTRHWRSTSVSYRIGPAWLLGLGMWGLFILPFWVTWKLLLAYLWLAAEVVLFTVTGIIALIALARREVRIADITLTRLPRWGLFTITLKGARP